MADATIWDRFRGQEVVLDVVSQYVILGTLEGVDTHFATLTDADCHDLRDSKTTRELYVLQARQHGIRANRHRLSVRQNEIVSLSRLADVVE
jgi:small nuclear ribonucleoprotein (snRNP)-like protein